MILIFSIAMDADNSFYLKFIANEAPTFFGYIISVLAMMHIVYDKNIPPKTIYLKILRNVVSILVSNICGSRENIIIPTYKRRN